MSGDVAACVEIGASSMQTVLLSDGAPVSVLAGAQQPPAGAPLLIAVGATVLGHGRPERARRARQILHRAAAVRVGRVRVEVAAKVASILIGPGASRLQELEKQTRRRFYLQPKDETHLDHFLVVAENQNQPAPPAQLEKLVQDGRIHPARIEQLVEDSKVEVENSIREET